jgi:hypothetical protein
VEARKSAKVVSIAGQVRRSEGVKAKSFFILFILATWSDLRTAGRAKDAGGRQLQGTAALLSLRRIYPHFRVTVNNPG